jgi:hypothetical protein
MTQLPLLLVAAAGLLVSPASVRHKLKADKRRVVADNIALSDAEAHAFWPVYEAYQLDLERTDQRIAAFVNTYAKASSQGPLSNDACKRVVLEYLAIKVAEVELERSYVEKLEQLLPPSKLERYLQLERRARAQAKYGLAPESALVH